VAQFGGRADPGARQGADAEGGAVLARGREVAGVAETGGRQPNLDVAGDSPAERSARDVSAPGRPGLRGQRDLPAGPAEGQAGSPDSHTGGRHGPGGVGKNRAGAAAPVRSRTEEGPW